MFKIFGMEAGGKIMQLLMTVKSLFLEEKPEQGQDF
jgi:hypothetical protein